MALSEVAPLDNVWDSTDSHCSTHAPKIVKDGTPGHRALPTARQRALFPVIPSEAANGRGRGI